MGEGGPCFRLAPDVGGTRLCHGRVLLGCKVAVVTTTVTITTAQGQATGL